MPTISQLVRQGRKAAQDKRQGKSIDEVKRELGLDE